MLRHPDLSHQLSPERWKALEPVVDAALELTDAERRRFVDDKCGRDSVARAEIEWMIAECLRDDPALDRPAIERFASLFEGSAAEHPVPSVVAGRFRLERELGRGGMATVYLARDLKHSRDVALKMVHPELAALIGGERFLREIQVTATLRHPHILPLFDSGEADGFLYFVMPYVEGGTLRDLLTKKGGALPRADAVRIASQVADGLASAHQQGIVHRDIKPENILLAADGRHAYVADFGIALALSHAERESASGSWLRLGTPAYMSPEQLGGGVELDARTDIYSLGCVMREMLVGVPPRRRASEARPARERQSIATRWRRLRRRFAGGSLERVVDRALAESTADRFQSAQDLGRELTLIERDVRAGPSRGWWRAVAAATTIVALGAAAATLSPVRDRIRAWLGNKIDPDLTVVLPFRGDSTGLAVLSGGNAARLLYDALGRWKDLKLGDQMAADEAGRRHGIPPMSIAEARTVSRGLGAGRFIWGEVSEARGVTRVSAQLYDERSPAQPITHAVYLSAEDGAQAKIEEIADSLVAKLVGTPAASAGANGTHTFAALKRYANGYAALRDWNTDLAEQDFRGAVDLDPRFPQAWLGVAQSMAWSGRHRAPDWLEPASRALEDSNALSARDRLLAGGLFALAQSRMSDACDIYRKLIARDSRDFAAHYGLGDCLSMDRLVIRDASSATGWRFRGSLHTATQEYVRALDLVPSYLEGSRGQTFARLTERILFTGPGDYRRGFALTPDTLRLRAFPEISHDTLAFFPRPELKTHPASQPEAVERNREMLRTLTKRWVDAFPRSGTAWEHYAGALESLGVLGSLDETGRGPGALGALTIARRWSGDDSTASVRRAAAHVRILLKLRRFEAARAVAESALVSRPVPTSAEASVLAPLAALAGRPRLTARLLASAVADSTIELFTDPLGGRRRLPAPVLAAEASFAAYAALGGPTDSLRASRDRLDHAVRISVAGSARDTVLAAVLLPLAFQAEPALGPALMTGLHQPRERLLPQWQALARGDTAGVRRWIDREFDRPAPPGEIPAPDVFLQYALLALAAHDTSGARVILDQVVAALPELSPRLTTQVFPAAALPRLLLLRARLTPRDESRSALWSSAKVLWRGAEPELRVAADSISR